MSAPSSSPARRPVGLMIEQWQPGHATAEQAAAVRTLLAGVDQQFDPPLSSRPGGLETCSEGVLGSPGYVAHVDGKPAGFLSYVDYEAKKYYPGPVRYINYVGVADGFKGRGIAGALMDAFDLDAIKDGIETTGGRTWGSNDGSRALFGSRGYKEVRLVADPIRRTSGLSVYFSRDRDDLLSRDMGTQRGTGHHESAGLGSL